MKDVIILLLPQKNECAQLAICDTSAPKAGYMSSSDCMQDAGERVAHLWYSANNHPVPNLQPWMKGK